MEVGAVGLNGRNQVQLAETTDSSREQGSATIQLQPTMEETVMVFQSKLSQFLFHDAVSSTSKTSNAVEM